MDKVEIVPAIPAHAYLMATYVRDADRAELWASSMREPLDVMLGGIMESSEAWTATINGDIVALWGVVPYGLLTGSGAPWLVSSDLLPLHSRTFLRESRRIVRAVCDRYGLLHNYVDDRNTAAIRWLRFLGFTIGEPRPHGALGLPFRHFQMRATHV